MKIRQCDNFLAVAGMDSEIQKAINNLRKMFQTEHSDIVLLLTFVRYLTE